MQIPDLEKIHDEYYASNGGKNTFIKKNQKYACAEEVCKKIPLETLMRKTFWIVPHTNRIFVNYHVLKMYAHPGVFYDIVDEVLRYCEWCVYENPSNPQKRLELHVNVDTATISAAERYIELIKLFNSECFVRNSRYYELLDGIFLYNVPSVIDNILTFIKPFIPKEIHSKFVLYKKAESAEHMRRCLAEGSP